MQIEVRVSNIQQLNEVLNLDVDMVGIGNEGCSYKGFEATDLHQMIALIKKQDKGKRIRLVTPKVPQASFDHVNRELIPILRSGEIDYLTINDFGLLYNLIQGKVNLSGIQVDVGRWLIYTPAVNPGFLESFKELQDEREMDYNITNHTKISFLKEYAVSGVEINFIPDFLKNTAAFLKQNHFRINGHLKYLLIAAGRSCNLARILNLSKGECHHYCDSICDLSLDKIYKFPFNDGFDTFSFYKTPERAFQKRFLYHAMGNLIFIKKDYDFKEIKESNMDSMILDRRAFSAEEIIRMLDWLKKERDYEKNAG